MYVCVCISVLIDVGPHMRVVSVCVYAVMFVCVVGVCLAVCACVCNSDCVCG